MHMRKKSRTRTSTSERGPAGRDRARVSLIFSTLLERYAHEGGGASQDASCLTTSA